MGYEIVDKDEVPKRSNRGGPTELSLLLETGAVVFAEGRQYRTMQNPGSYLAKRGYRIFHTLAERNGVHGAYIWAEKRDDTNGKDT